MNGWQRADLWAGRLGWALIIVTAIYFSVRSLS
jgi:hypothetical protein